MSCCYFREAPLEREQILALASDRTESKPLARVMIVGVVHEGLGDHYGMISLAERVQNLYPESVITIYSEVIGLHGRKRSFSVPPGFTHLSVGLTRPPLSRFSFEREEDRRLQGEVEALAKRMDLVITTPHQAYVTSLNLEEVPSLRITEIGAGCTFRSKDSARIGYSMGFSPHEFGLPWVDECFRKERRIEDLGCDLLREFLLDGEKRPFYMGYFHQGAIADQFLASIPPEERAKVILIGGECRKEGDLLMRMDRLSHEDMLTLISLANEPIGCTGDLSLMEVLSSKKAPFYEVMVHKEGLKQGLLYAIEVYPGPKLTLKSYFNSYYGAVTLLKDKDQRSLFFKEWSFFVAWLREHYDFNAFLPGLIRKVI
jgi:hypothetical protein